MNVFRTLLIRAGVAPKCHFRGAVFACGPRSGIARLRKPVGLAPKRFTPVGTVALSFHFIT